MSTTMIDIEIDGPPLLLLLTPNNAPPSTASLLRTHGFTVIHIPTTTHEALASVIDSLSSSMPYGIVAFSDACAHALELAAFPARSLKVVVAYNPPASCVPADKFRDGIEVVLHRSRLEVEEGGVEVVEEELKTGKGHGHPGKVYWYDVETIEAGDRLAMVRTLGWLKATLGGWTGVEEAVGLDGQGVWRRVVGVDAVVDEEFGGRCVVRDVAGGSVVAERVYMTREAWEREQSNAGRRE